MVRDAAGQGERPRDAARNGGHPPAPLRKAELPVCAGRGAPRGGDPHLLARQSGTLGDPPPRAGRSGESCDTALPGGPPRARDDGELRARRADRPAAPTELIEGAFSSSGELYRGLVGFLSDAEAAGLTHAELESRLDHDGRELLRQLLQDHLDLRSSNEARSDAVLDERGVAHRAVEPGHHRPLTTLFGPVTLTRLAYRAKGCENLHLADAALNLPEERHSHGLRACSAIEAARGSYDEARAAILRATGQCLGKRQIEELARRAATDVGDFYDKAAREPAKESDVLVLSADGKGIVMRPDALRLATAKAAQQNTHKLATRLTRGEKKDRKRMAELACVYDCPPVPRIASDVLARAEDGPKPKAPVAQAKWLTASVSCDARTVIKAAFDEGERRDPEHRRTWIALVDGAKHQINVIRTEARARGVDVTIVVDFVHVLEYLWGAARCFFSETDPAGEAFVGEKALVVLEGKAGLVAGALARKATMLGLDATTRKRVDDCVAYLKNKQPYLDYRSALANGWPIATGVIEGACAHLVRDRFDITGARWSLEGAEAILKIRAVRANGDWDEYWNYHLSHEHERVHESRYADGVIPRAA
jgi:hypothetical protein